MEDSKSQGHQEEIKDKKFGEDSLEINNKEAGPISNNEQNKPKDLEINLSENSIEKGENTIIKDKLLEDNKIENFNSKLNANINEGKKNSEDMSNQLIKENKSEDNDSAPAEPKSDTANNKLAENIDKVDEEISKEKKSEVNKLTISEPNINIANNKSAKNIDKSNKEISKEKILDENKKDVSSPKNKDDTVSNIPKDISTNVPVKAKVKPVKEPPIEKKPFLEFVNDFLIPEIKNEFKSRGKEVNKINLQRTHRPIAEDICWVIYCEINDTCNFWLSFEKDDITSLKSFSLCKNYEKPSIIESFLIDEKKITLKLIISRILQRLNGQKLIGAN